MPCTCTPLASPGMEDSGTPGRARSDQPCLARGGARARPGCDPWSPTRASPALHLAGARAFVFLEKDLNCQMAKKTTWRPRAPGGRGDARGEPGRCGDGTPRVSAQKADGIPFKRALAPTGSESARAVSRRRLGPSAGSRFVGRAVPRAGVHRAGALERIRARGGVRARMLPVETCVARTGLRVTHFGGNVGA